MSKTTKFSPGQKWRCESGDSHWGAFTFVIVGPGDKPNRIICDIVYDKLPRGKKANNPILINRNFSRSHLKRYAKHISEEK